MVDTAFNPQNAREGFVLPFIYDETASPNLRNFLKASPELKLQPGSCALKLLQFVSPWRTTESSLYKQWVGCWKDGREVQALQGGLGVLSIWESIETMVMEDRVERKCVE